MAQKNNINKIENINIDNMDEEVLSTKVTDEDMANAIDYDIEHLYLDESGVKYSVDEKRLLKASKCDIRHYIVPEDTKVICDEAFYRCKIEFIALPDSLEIIGDWVFEDCEFLKSITLPKSLKKIGENPFPGLKLNIINNSPYFHVEEDILYTSDRKTLISCVSSSDTIRIPEGVTTIGDSAFISCNSIKSIILPETLTKIGKYAFRGCISLNSITLPSSLQIIEGNPFATTELNIINNSPYFCLEDGVLYTADKETLISCLSSSNTIQVPEGVSTIGESAFDFCKNLKLLFLPNSLNTIKESALAWCSSLESLLIPDNVKIIGEYAFSGCKSLESITLPNSIHSIGENAFQGCNNLRTCFKEELRNRFGYIIKI